MPIHLIDTDFMRTFRTLPATIRAAVLGAVEWFVPSGAMVAVDRMRARLYVVASLLVAANSAVFGVLHALHLPPGIGPTIVWVVAGLGVVCLMLPFLMRMGGPLRLLGPLFVVVFLVGLATIASYDGGLASGASYWLIVLPLAASFIGGSRLGWAGAAGSVVIGGGLYLAEAMGHVFPVSLGPEDAVLHIALNAISCAGVVAALARLYEGPMVQHFRDLSDQLGATNARLESELAERRQAQHAAEVASRAKDHLLANLSHEFRTPIGAILSGTELLRLSYRGPDPHLLCVVEQGGQRLLSALDAVLDIAWIGSGGLGHDTEVVEVGAVADRVVSGFRCAADAGGLDLAVHADRTRVEINAEALDRMLSALVENAVRFTEAGQVTVTVCAERQGATIEIADTGVGMTPQFLTHAFEPFRQASVGLGRTHEGLGLGLGKVRQIADLVGATVTVESAPDVGTTVRLWVPGAVSEPEPSRMPERRQVLA